MKTSQEKADRALAGLALRPVGDVVAARACARELLGCSDLPEPLQRDSLLLLTAVCFHLHAQDALEPELSAVVALLEDLRTGSGVQSLASSPSSFLQFVAAELEEFGLLVFARPLALALEATRESAATGGGSERQADRLGRR